MSLAGLGGVTGSSGGGLLSSLTPVAASASGYKYTPAMGTGILPFISWAGKQGLLNAATISAVVPELPGLFGGYPYPSHKGTEIGPDALFIALFAVLFLANLGVWGVNLIRKQNFFMQLGVAFFCLVKTAGFACRLAWAYDVTRLRTAISSVVFIQVAQLILLAMNLLLSHRVFTWRHPETGRCWPLVWFINLIYLIVLAIIAMAIVGQSLPYLYYLTEHHYNMCKNVFKAAAILNLFFATLPFQFLLLAYALKPGTIVKMPKVLNKQNNQEERMLPPVYQASWIKSANIFYYPSRNSQVPVYKGEPGSDAIRIMPSREPPGNNHRQHGEPMHPNAPRMKWATLTVIITSLLLLLNTCFRVAACFRNGEYGTPEATGGINVSFWPHHPYVMFIFYGGTEVAVITLYLLMRIDLRFYIPDMPRKVPKDGTPSRFEQATTTADEPIAWNTNTVAQENLTKEYSDSNEYSADHKLEAEY